MSDIKRFCLAASVVILVAQPALAAPPRLPLPANTWVPVKYTLVQPRGAGPEDRGDWMPAGWNKLVYDPIGKRMLFNDRWGSKRSGGYSIYGNCLFSFDLANGQVLPLRMDNWTKIDKDGGYRTIELPANAKEPTPCSRHVYHGFEFVPELNAVFVCNGANGTAMKGGQLLAHTLTANLWRLDLKTYSWTQLSPPDHPFTESLDDGMAYCPDTRSLILDHAGQIWIYDLGAAKWHRAKQDAPTGGAGQTVFYDPPRKRMLLLGGASTDYSVMAEGGRRKDPSSQKLYAFDPKAETVARLADCPTGNYSAALAYDSKFDVFLMAVVMKYRDMPSGTFCYDPKKDAWQEVRTANPTPDVGSWSGWVKLAYDVEHECFAGWLHPDKFYAFRYAPGPSPTSAPAGK